MLKGNFFNFLFISCLLILLNYKYSLFKINDEISFRIEIFLKYFNLLHEFSHISFHTLLLKFIYIFGSSLPCVQFFLEFLYNIAFHKSTMILLFDIDWLKFGQIWNILINNLSSLICFWIWRLYQLIVLLLIRGLIRGSFFII